MIGLTGSYSPQSSYWNTLTWNPGMNAWVDSSGTVQSYGYSSNPMAPPQGQQPSPQQPQQPNFPPPTGAGQPLIPQEVSQGYQGIMDWLGQMYGQYTQGMLGPGGPMSQIASGDLWNVSSNPYMQQILGGATTLANQQYNQMTNEAMQRFGQAGLQSGSGVQQAIAQGAVPLAANLGQMSGQLGLQNYNQQMQNTMSMFPWAAGIPGQTVGALTDLYGLQQQSLYNPLQMIQQFISGAPVTGAVGMMGQPSGNTGMQNLASMLPFIGMNAGANNPAGNWAGQGANTGYSGMNIGRR